MPYWISVILEFCKVAETNFRFCCYSYWNLYASYAKRNVLFKLIKTFTKSQRVSDSFENITVKIKCLQYINIWKQSSHILKYVVVKITTLRKGFRHRSVEFRIWWCCILHPLTPSQRISGKALKDVSRGRSPWQLWHFHF